MQCHVTSRQTLAMEVKCVFLEMKGTQENMLVGEEMFEE